MRSRDPSKSRHAIWLGRASLVIGLVVLARLGYAQPNRAQPPAEEPNSTQSGVLEPDLADGVSDGGSPNGDRPDSPAARPPADRPPATGAAQDGDPAHNDPAHRGPAHNNRPTTGAKVPPLPTTAADKPAAPAPIRPQIEGIAPVGTAGVVISADVRLLAEERPWAIGVSLADQRTAQELFRAGNRLLREDLMLAEALDKYQQAIAIWDHPAIRFHMAVALHNLARPVAAYANINAALRYGAAPLDPQVYTAAQNYKRSLEAQLAQVEIACAEPDAVVTLNGRVVLTGPGNNRQILRPGEYQIVARKPGYIPWTTRLRLLPGERKPIHIGLVSLADTTVTERRWYIWQPWAVIIASTAVALGGGSVRWQAEATARRYEELFHTACPKGCEPENTPESLLQLERQLQWQNRLGIGGLVAGGVGFASGLVMAIINQPRPVQRDHTTVTADGQIPPNRARTSGGGFVLTPQVSSSAAGVVASWQF